MTHTISSLFHRKISSNRNPIIILTISFVLLAIIGIGQDYISSLINKNSFYLSESSLYKVIWLLFIPLLPLNNYFTGKINKMFSINKWLFIAIFSMVYSIVHIYLASGAIYILSSILMDHTFTTFRVFRYFVSADFYIILIIYSAFLIYLSFHKFTTGKITKPVLQQKYLRLIEIIANSKTILVAVEDVICIKSDRPYIAIVTKDNRYMHSSTLKKISTKLDSTCFVRIHRSTIININYIICLHSRSNGDYDVEMKNGEYVRMSRNYSRDLKSTMTSSRLSQ